MTVFNILNTKKSINLDYNIRKKDFNKPFNPLDKKGTIYKQKSIKDFIDKVNTDHTSLNILETNITDILISHKDFLNSHLPEEIDIEIVRSKKTEQVIHNLRHNNQFYFKTLQEFFLSKKDIKTQQRKDKISAESSQTLVLQNNKPKISIAVDFSKDFDYENPPVIFDKHLTELRKNIPLLIGGNIPKSNKIITELILLHEISHIIFDKKIDETYFKAAYEIKNENYNGQAIQQFVRLAHEGFADGLSTYLASSHYNKEILDCYSKVREKTKHHTEEENSINIYETTNVINQVQKFNNNTPNIVNIIFDISLNNALDVLSKKIKTSLELSNNLSMDLEHLQSKGCFKIKHNIVDGLKENIYEQLKNPLPLKEILLKESIENNHQQVYKNVDLVINKFRTENNKSLKHKI